MATNEQLSADDVRAQWEAEAEAIRRARVNKAGTNPIDAIASRSGLEFLQAVFSGELPHPPIGETLNFLPIRAEYGRVVFQGTPMAAHYNPIGSVHGGWAATLLDSCVGCAVQSVLPKGKGYTTLELKVNFVRGLSPETGPVRAEGTVVHAGSRTATAEGRLVDAAGKLYAHATTTCLIMELPRG
ncbi:MAG: PaaI family thioesterase [Ectothiorhodospiraceae bacterium]|nr:PaaI family thioesterase [Ectothiorhodospiraceae bacterium]